ncbi:Serine-protein kinase ATM [Anthophora quadrimaculata]
MSKYLERIDEILKNANSKKVTDKRKCVLELLELFENKEIIEEICKSTENSSQGVANWSYIIHIVHKILLNETDRLAYKDTYNKATIIERQNTCALIQKTFQYANSYKVPLLKCKDIIPLILQILRTSTYEYYHETYINVLISYILPFRTYQVHLLPEHWEELLKICVCLYKHISSLTSKRAVLDALQMIIEYGCLHSNLFLNVKEILLFLENIFLDVKTNQEILAESSYKLTNTVCQQIATEYRITLCLFSENILPNIICLKSSDEKYKLLLLFVQIHHPKGACKSNDGAYANDWEKWYTILKNIYLMILKELKVDVLLKNFIYLATEVFKQILENSDIIIEKKSFDECDYVQSIKRRRIAAKISGPVDMLNDNSPEEAWPMIQILIILFKQYPECLKSEDLPTFLKTLVDFLTQSSKNEDIMDTLYELAAVLLVNEKVFFITDIENANMYWDKIWDILLRSLNLNQNEITTHKLTQLFITNNKITNRNALLKLYLTNVIKWSVMSLRTLIILCQYFPLPSDITVFNINAYSPTMNSNSVRSCLIKWVLHIPWQKIATQIIIDELCSLLIGITSKAQYQQQIKLKEYNTSNLCDCLTIAQNTESLYEHIEQCYLLLTYKSNLFIEKQKKDIEDKPKVNEHILYMQDTITFLIDNLYDITDDNGSDDLHVIIIKIAIIAKTISMLRQLNISKDIKETSLVEAMKNYLNIAYTSLENIDPLRSKYAYLCNITKALNTLYGTSYDTDVAKIIVSSATLNMLKNVFSFMNIEDNEITDYETSNYCYDGYGSFQSRRKYLDREIIQKKQCSFCNKGTIRIQATKALALFCCIKVKQEKYEIQVKLMNNLLTINMYDLSHTVDFKMAITVLKSLPKYGTEQLWKNHKELPLKSLLELYDECYQDETAFRYILSVLPYFFMYATKYNFLPVRSEEIKEILNFTVITLVPIAQIGDLPVSLEILEFLLIDEKELLHDAIKKLNSFPNIPIFQKIRNVHNALKYRTEEVYSLKKEVQYFLNTMIDKDIRCSVEDITHLRIQLSTRKKELWELYNKLETFRGFAEDCSSSMLHQLVYKLVKLTTSSDITVSIEAVKCLEISCETILNDDNNLTNVSKIEYIYELSPQQGRVIQNILRDSYTKIGDFDAIRGTGSSHLQDHSTRIQHYVHTNEWNEVILAQDVELSCGNMTAIREMINGLHQSGLQYILSHFISTITKNCEKVDEDIQYESAWRLSNWNICETNQALYTQKNCNLKLEITENDYHFYHYQALKYFHEGNEIGTKNAIQNARISIIKGLRNISLESSKTIYEKLMQLQLIREIEELNSAEEDEYEKILYKWQQQDIANLNEFQYIEPILTQRIVMFQINDILITNANIKTALSNTYLQISKIAADKKNLHIATRSLAVLAKQKDLPPKIQDQLCYQESLLARLRKDLEVGRFLLRSLMHKENLDINLRAQILRVYGDWMAETKSENPQTVIQKYYLKSIDTSSSISAQTADTIKNLHNTQIALARFADNQFEQISSYMKSPQFENLKECITYSSKGINEHTITEDTDLRSAMILNQRQNTNDVAELEHIQKERDNYLTLALKYYLIALQQSECYNLLVFRIIALWLDNIYLKEVNDLLEINLNKIPSFKFIPLVPQLAAHMNDDYNDFSGKIYNVMKRCALDHPHHTLPVLLALKNLYGDHNYNTTRKSKAPGPRVLGARKLLKELMESNVGLILQKMEKLSHALVMLANLATSSNKSGCVVNIPRNQEILKIKNFDNIFVPTLTITLKPSKCYDDIIGITKYVETYETVGGINTPKKLTCIGTDGICRHQLVKGKDDLRQDAVMQQVFNVMNTLLKACKETKRRKLIIRTYKVVPLTQRSGILEWCDNTIPIITTLIGSNGIPGLHKKYYPKDYTANFCKEKLAAVGKSSTDVKLKVFLDCCAHMRPVMHYFFIENYLSPETWFERRLAYTRSIATTSIAGYVLGLGDRHLNNILIDQTTAEVIHIDFGIAFEQGKVLPVPETIPFRLTRNIEVGMGVSGIEGTMRYCCEEILTVLRDQRQIIITLLQVLLYDPLFKWTITPAKARNIQSGSSSRLVEINQCSTGTNKTAERALLRIEQKLQGTEEGLASSVSGQVERLIQQARDPINLCRLYHGWQPYL